MARANPGDVARTNPDPYGSERVKLHLARPLDSVSLGAENGTPRTISGLAVPWNTTANASTGPVRFLPGSLPTDGKAPKLLRDHDRTEPIGLVVERIDTPDGMRFLARISETAAGDEALILAADGVLDAVSVGVEPVDYAYEGNVLVVKSAVWDELSVVPFPAFAAAAIDRVSLSGADAEPTETPEPETETVTVLDDVEPDPETENPMSETVAASVADLTIPSAPLPVRAARPRVTAGDYLSALITGKTLPHVEAANDYLSDIPGLLPEPLLGEIFETTYTRRPLVDAVGVRAMPGGGELFVRRFVSQHTDVDVQASEGAALASQAYQVARVTVEKSLVGGSITLSAQSADWSEPSLVNLVVQDMIRMYSRRTEGLAAAYLDTHSTTATETVALWTDADDIIDALYKGAAEMFDTTGAMPTHLIVAPETWAKIGTSVTSTGAYGFPFLSPSNAAGQSTGGAAEMRLNPLGLAVVATPGFATAGIAGDRAFLLYAPAVEIYEGGRTQVRVDNPATATASLGVWNSWAMVMMNEAGGPPSLSPYSLAL